MQLCWSVVVGAVLRVVPCIDERPTPYMLFKLKSCETMFGSSNSICYCMKPAAAKPHTSICSKLSLASLF
jgi:hypothetical protein